MFAVFYFPAFLFALFFGTGRDFAAGFAMRQINWIPLVHTILPYVTGTAQTNAGTPILNLLANLLLFVPIGFYMGVLSRRIHPWLRAALLVGLPIAVEALQYALARGVADIDDVLLNCLGGALGLLIFFELEWAYRAHQRDPGARLFTLERNEKAAVPLPGRPPL